MNFFCHSSYLFRIRSRLKSLERTEEPGPHVWKEKQQRHGSKLLAHHSRDAQPKPRPKPLSLIPRSSKRSRGQEMPSLFVWIRAREAWSARASLAEAHRRQFRPQLEAPTHP